MRMIASAGGAGFIPRAPGTFGSFVALLAGAGLLGFGWDWLLLGTVLATGIGWWAVRSCVTDPAEDPGWVVIDEVAGQWLTMLAVPTTHWGWYLAAFALFRLFDILKPGPIGWADRQHGATGIMADDVLAGIAAALVLLVARAMLGQL